VYPVQGLTALPLAPPLCRAGGRTCAACCYGEAVSRPELERRLTKQTALFGWLIGNRSAGRGRLLLHELLARGLPGLAWALLLLVPVLAFFLRPWLRRRVVCAFLGYEDAERTRVGCLLHPSRHAGVDVRRQAAFVLWHGFGCGAAGYLCQAAARYALAGWHERKQFVAQTEGLDWFEYGRRTATFPERGQGQNPQFPSPVGPRLRVSCPQRTRE
jgi:hypothetical protein